MNGMFLHLLPQPNLALENFLHAFHMEDMNALKSVGGGYCQKEGSLSSSNSSSEEDSTWASSSWTLGVNTACKQLLYALVIHSGATNTQSYEEKTSSGKKFLHKRVTNTGYEYLEPLVHVELVMRQWSMIVLMQTVCCFVIRS